MTGPEAPQLLPLSDNQLRQLLAPVGFADWPAAARSLQRLADEPAAAQALADFLPTLLLNLTEAANPDKVLVSLERLARSVPERPAFFRDLAGDPRAVEILVTLLASSQFLTEILLRHPHYFERLAQHKHLAQTKSPAQFYERTQEAIAPWTEPQDQLNALRRFQRWELLRIGTCDLLGLLDLPTVTAQLSHLADSLAQACLAIAARQTDTDPAGFAVIGMGKLGGEELNYSSDIDLLFLSSSGSTQYQRLGERLIDALTQVTAEGFLYRVDMRLRPWGSVGPLVTSVGTYLSYLRQNARLWEKQALLKARVIAGNREAGAEFLRRAEPLIFDSAGDLVRADVRAMKTKIESHLRQQGRDWGEVKLGQGSIRDIEFVTQYLQLAYGDTHPEIRSHNTLDALARLYAAGFVSPDEYRVLADGYTFLRPVEHWLQMMHYRQTHTLPSEPEPLTLLAQRLGFQGPSAGDKFLARYQQHTAAIRTVYQAHLGDEDRDGEKGNPGPAHRSSSTRPPAPVAQHLARLSPSYLEVFTEAEIEHHAELAEQLDADHLVHVEAVPQEGGRWRVSIIGYDYLGELSLICGLLFVHGLNILDGQVFTYQPLARTRLSTPVWRPQGQPWQRPASSTARPDSRRKIVDVFTVRPIKGKLAADFWQRYADDLAALLRRLEAGEQREVQGEVAKRFANALRQFEGASPRLYPIEIVVDNASSEQYTLLNIDALDTVGFLYEFANALAMNGVYIARVIIETVGSRVQDTLYVTDAHGRKITAPNKERELRAAVVLIKHFTHLLPLSPNPEAALLHFRQFLGQLFTRPNWPDELTSLEQPDVLDALARLLGVSDFLWSDFLRMQHANLFPVVRDVDALATAKTMAQLRAELEALLQDAPDGEARREAINAFKDREMFRVDMRHILGHITEFGQFSRELSELAEVVVQAAFRLCYEGLLEQFGQPRLAADPERPCPISLCALGKFGGRELGFASDIELIFVYAGAGRTSGPNVISAREFYEKLVHEVINTIRAKREGIFEIDLRLRPYGRAGSLAVSLDSLRRYFAPDGSAWAYERQALVKLRPVAGDDEFSRQVLALRDDIVYNGQPFDVAAMRGMRERQIRHLVTAGTINAKHSPGGLVDVEYLVQGLQIAHGHRDPSLRLTNTREAMAALAAAGILSPEDYAQLHEAHIFLRRLINGLRMVRGNAWDLTVPPPDSEEFAFLARRLNYNGDLARLQDDLSRHTGNVQELSTRLLD